jgi:hypothetical protein
MYLNTFLYIVFSNITTIKGEWGYTVAKQDGGMPWTPMDPGAGSRAGGWVLVHLLPGHCCPGGFRR